MLIKILYLREQNPNLLHDAKQREHFHREAFHGFDFDNTMLRIGSMNMLLHGVENPDIRYPKLRVQRFSPASLHYGVLEHRVDGATLRVTDVAKTVADCFKFRNKVGLDVALEVLREAVQARRTTVDAIWAAAKVCRVTAVMRPYLESLA